MSDDFKPCKISPKAADKLEESVNEICYALVDSVTKDVINVYSPGTNWIKAAEGARNLECDYAQIACKVSFEVLPQYQIYKNHEDLTRKNNVQRPKTRAQNFSGFESVEINELATRKFVSTGTTTFLALLSTANHEIVAVFPRGTPYDDVGNFGAMLSCDIVLVKARTSYKLLGLIKIEKTYEQLRRK